MVGCFIQFAKWSQRGHLILDFWVTFDFNFSLLILMITASMIVELWGILILQIIINKSIYYLKCYNTIVIKPLEFNDREGRDFLQIPSFDSEAAWGVLFTVKPEFFLRLEFTKY